MARPLWFVSLLKKTVPGRFLLARLTRLPAAGSLVERWLFAGDDLLYLPADGIIPVNHELDPGPQTVLPSQVVEHFAQGAVPLDHERLHLSRGRGLPRLSP